jgi:hypothetical protein
MCACSRIADHPFVEKFSAVVGIDPKEAMTTEERIGQLEAENTAGRCMLGAV